MTQVSKKSVRFISLGCPKNLVDSEIMAGGLKREDFDVKNNNEATDIGIVNTCGFIEDSKQESINAILELAEEKKKGNLKLLIVTGCLSQRYKEELPKLLPEVDAFIGTNDFSQLSHIIDSKLSGSKKRNFIREPKDLPTVDSPRILTTPKYTRYVKVSEGCSHACSFCTIPLMRGGLKSRELSDVTAEIQRGVNEGVREFNLIAQDLNEYGRDLAKRGSLHHLLENIKTIDGDYWVRLLYMYPLQFPDKLVTLIKNHPHVIPYVDIPLQHIHDDILKSMKRGSSARYIHRLINKLKTEIPNIVLRTTFIVGYPGETEKHFAELMKFIREMEFDRLGVFTYSQEEGTSSSLLKRQIPKKTAQERRDALMILQQGISKKKNSALIGKNIRVLYEGIASDVPPEAPVPIDGIGRYYGQAPEIDGEVFLKNLPTSVKPGDFIEAKVSQALPYDLVANFTKVSNSHQSTFSV